jgi:EAL domain-containing protein (putative c-di-GMP-specific phosphodiesterase class I)
VTNDKPPLSSGHATVDELIRSAVDLARVCLRMDVGFVTEFRDGVRVFRHVASAEGFAPIAVGDANPLEESYCQRIVSGEIPALVQDSYQYPVLKALRATEALQIRAHVGVPVRFSDGSVFGTFCCYSRDPHADLSQTDVSVLTRFAWLIGQLLEPRVLAERAREQGVARLLAVIGTDRLNMVFQPVIDVALGKVVGYEALARFNGEPVRAPDVWFNEAHDVQLGLRLETVAFDKALAALGAIPADAYLALNVSPHMILSGTLARALATAPLARLMLEVTEHSSIPDYGVLSEALAALRKGGLRLAVDDAGSGYASFRHILKLKPDVIKLDQSLIRDIDIDPGSRALAAALITFAAQTGSGVVAEGVETEDELATLRTLGVSTAQGFLLGRPGGLPLQDRPIH